MVLPASPPPFGRAPKTTLEDAHPKARSYSIGPVIRCGYVSEPFSLQNTDNIIILSLQIATHYYYYSSLPYIIMYSGDNSSYLTLVNVLQ